MLVIGAVVIFAAIALLVIGLSQGKANPMQARIAAIRGETYDNFEVIPPPEPMSSRVFGPLGAAIAEKMKALLPIQFVKAIEFRLVQAGEPITLSGFLVIVVIVEGAMLFVGFILALSSGGLQGRGILVLIGLGFLGLFMPRIWLGNQVRSRQKEILKSLPDAFDLVTTCVEAGLGLDASLAKVAEKVSGPFAEDLALALREVSMGKLRRDALKEMALKAGVPDLVVFINAVVQAETMGTSIATVLRVQADQMRVRRRQRAEQQAYQAPVKMIFPLVLCIFPTLFIVILGPAAITIYQNFVQK